MTAITYGTAPAAVAKAKPAKSFWARVYDAIIEARMRQVEREIRNHVHLIPQDVLKSSGYRATLSDSKDLPFVK